MMLSIISYIIFIIYLYLAKVVIRDAFEISVDNLVVKQSFYVSQKAMLKVIFILCMLPKFGI